MNNYQRALEHSLSAQRNAETARICYEMADRRTGRERDEVEAAKRTAIEASLRVAELAEIFEGEGLS